MGSLGVKIPKFSKTVLDDKILILILNFHPHKLRTCTFRKNPYITFLDLHPIVLSYLQVSASWPCYPILFFVNYSTYRTVFFHNPLGYLHRFAQVALLYVLKYLKLVPLLYDTNMSSLKTPLSLSDRVKRYILFLFQRILPMFGKCPEKVTTSGSWPGISER